MKRLGVLFNSIEVHQMGPDGDMLFVSDADSALIITTELASQMHPERLDVTVRRVSTDGAPEKDPVFDITLEQPVLLGFSTTMIRWRGYAKFGKAYQPVRVELRRLEDVPQ